MLKYKSLYDLKEYETVFEIYSNKIIIEIYSKVNVSKLKLDFGKPWMELVYNLDF